MKGVNRPLLTKLIHQEVDIEIRQEERSMDVEVHFHSDKVIQAWMLFYISYRVRLISLEVICQYHVDYVLLIFYNQCGGELAELDDDAIVKSIGMGNTDCLSSLSGLIRKDKEEDVSSDANAQKVNINLYKF